MTMSGINKVIERMVTASGMKNASKMSDFIGFSSGAVSQWKKRKNIPTGSLARVSAKTGVSIEWLNTGEGEMQSGGQSTPLNRDVLDKTIERTEYILEKTNRTLNPTQKAAFISTLYEMAMEQGESALEDTNVARLIRLVG